MKLKDNMMKSLKMSIFAFGMCLTMGVMAASTMDSTTGSEENLSGPSSSGLPNVRDCGSRTGSDKLLCEKEMQNDTTRSLPNDNARINRNNGNMIHDRKSRDLQSRDRELNNSQLNNSQPSNSQPSNSQANDLRRNDTQPRDTNPINSNPSSSGSDGSGTGTFNAM